MQLRQLLIAFCEHVLRVCGDEHACKVATYLTQYASHPTVSICGDMSDLLASTALDAGHYRLTVLNMCEEIRRCTDDCYRVAPVPETDIFELANPAATGSSHVECMLLQDIVDFVFVVASLPSPEQITEVAAVDDAMMNRGSAVAMLRAVYCQRRAADVPGVLRHAKSGVTCILADTRGRKVNFTPVGLHSADVYFVPFTAKRFHCIAYNGQWFDTSPGKVVPRFCCRHGMTVVAVSARCRRIVRAGPRRPTGQQHVFSMEPGRGDCGQRVAPVGTGRAGYSVYGRQGHPGAVRGAAQPSQRLSLRRGVGGDGAATSTILDAGFPCRNGHYAWPTAW